MKEGWEKQRIEHCFKLKSGDSLTSKMMGNDGIYPVFGGNGIAGLHDKFNLSGSNVIVGRVGALCGNVRHINEEIWLTDNAFKIVDFKFNFDNSFLTYLLNFKNLRDYARQAAQPVISNSSLKDVVLEFPNSLPEQKRIVSILDETFAAIAKAKANTEQNLKNAKELFESYLQTIFERNKEVWEVKNLIAICELFFDSPHRTPKYQIDGIPAVRPRDVVNGLLNLTDSARVSEEEYEIQTKRYKPKAGDIIYSRELSYGWAAKLPDNSNVCLSQGMCLFRPNSGVDTSYLLFVLNGSIGRRQAQNAAVGAAHPHINISDIKTYRIPMPSSNEQKIIVQKLDALSTKTKRLEAIYKQKIYDLEELKKSILQKAFSGELTTFQTKEKGVFEAV